MGQARLVAKSDLVLSGVEVFEWTFKTIDPETVVNLEIQRRKKKSEKDPPFCKIKENFLPFSKQKEWRLIF